MAQTKLTLFYTSFIEGHKFVRKLLAMITMPNKDLNKMKNKLNNNAFQ